MRKGENREQSLDSEKNTHSLKITALNEHHMLEVLRWSVTKRTRFMNIIQCPVFHVLSLFFNLHSFLFVSAILYRYLCNFSFQLLYRSVFPNEIPHTLVLSVCPLLGETTFKFAFSAKQGAKRRSKQRC